MQAIVTQRGHRPLPPHGRPFRIVSANLWNGAADPGAFAELIAGLAPDAVATQEMTPAQADALARVMPHGQLEPACDYNGMGIALREPAPLRRIALPYRDAHVAEVEWRQDSGAHLELEILNVHMHAPHSPLGRTTLRHRRGQLRGLLRYLEGSPRRRRVLVGDLNATPLWPLYRRLTALLTDAAVVAGRRHGRALQPTWGPGPRAPRLLRIDHGLVHGVAVDDFQVVPIAGSDHSAIVVDLLVPCSPEQPAPWRMPARAPLLASTPAFTGP